MANEFYATHIAPQAQAWLAGPDNGRILHLFPHACNLVNEQRAVLSLITGHIGPNPLAIVLPPLHLPDFITMHHSPLATRHSLSIGKLTIDLTTAVPWQPIPPWQNPLNLDLIHTIVSNHPHFQPAVPLHLACQMGQALHSQNRALIAQTARQLAGLGPGLTPAGDDFLVGVLYAVIRDRYSVIGHPITDDGSPITDYCPLITAAAVPHTTTLSANLLQAAGRGEAGQAWHDLLAATQTPEVYAAISRILHTGHSSGADALLGFLTDTATNW